MYEGFEAKYTCYTCKAALSLLVQSPWSHLFCGHQLRLDGGARAHSEIFKLRWW